MGKRVLFHPVGLFVIRGALEKAGFGVGRLRQVGLSPDSRHAKYTTEVTFKPFRNQGWLPRDVQIAMHDSFSNDVSVTKVWETKSGKLMCELETWLDGNPAVQPTLPGIAAPVQTVKDGFVVEKKKSRKKAERG